MVTCQGLCCRGHVPNFVTGDMAALPTDLKFENITNDTYNQSNVIDRPW